ncbi:MAG: endonuclease [Paludibacteraceae bacterium]|nr:endonuclease [Paludibacteraceae bacterium]
MRKHIICIFILCCGVNASFAAIPENYYASIAGKNGANLLSTLHSIIDNHTVIPYSSLEDYYPHIDFFYNAELEQDTLWDIYSTCTFTMDHANRQQSDFCHGWNKEHTVCQSWFGNGDMVSDLFQVLPTDARVNNLRSNWPYGETDTRNDKVTKGVKALGHLGGSSFPGYTNIGTVYEPDDQYKGDIARIYFYMVARYLDEYLNASNGSTMFTYVQNTTGLTDYSVALLMKWHRQDPVSQKEINRNDSVYQFQFNRNPFVDYPYLAEYIWGEKTNTNLNMLDVISCYDFDFIPGESSGKAGENDPSLRCATTTLIYPAIMQGEQATLSFTVQGYRLTSDITCSISGADASLFSVDPATIDAADANATHTYTVTYTPSAIGSHSALLTLTSTGAESFQIDLAAVCAQSCNVTWKIDGDATTAGDPTAQVALGGNVSLLPDAPSSCNPGSDMFMGWTATPLLTPVAEAPDDLFEEAEAAPVVEGDVTYYAVFAHESTTQGSEPATETASFTSADGYKNGNKIPTATAGSVTITFNKSGASTEATYYTTGNALRCYAKSKIELTGATITKVEFSFGTEDHTSNTITANTGQLNGNVWTGSTTNLIFTIGGDSKFRGIASLTITYVDQVTVTVFSDYTTSCGTQTALPEVKSKSASVRKILIDGQLYIEREGKIYNILGYKQLTTK